jgi:glutathione S-transferase
MMDIFDKQAPMAKEEHGSSGDMKKAQFMLQLLGTPWDANTLKCIIAAAEQGMEMQSGYLDVLNDEQDTESYRSIFEFGTYPGLKEADYNVAGATGILAFINARGLGFSLAPKNVTEAATQDFWIDVAVTEATPNINTIVQEQIVKKMIDSNYSQDLNAIDRARSNLESILNTLEKQLTGNPYIIGKYTFADIHWTALIHLLLLTDSSDLIEQRPQIKRWYNSLAVRKSNCGQNLVSFSLLPDIEDIKNKKLSSVIINDF